MKKRAARKVDSALEEILGVIDGLREQVATRLSEVDTDQFRKRAGKLAVEASRRSREARRQAEGRLRPRRRRGPGIAAFLIVGAVGAGVAYVLADAGRRRRLTESVRNLTSGARGRLDENGVTGAVDGMMTKLRPAADLQGAALKTEVEGALAAQGAVPAGLEISVEGRTVYLRGTVADAAALDRAMERIQELPGVVAVVNLTVPVEAGAAGPH